MTIINGQGPTDSFWLVLLEPMGPGETIKVTFRMVDGSSNWVGARGGRQSTSLSYGPWLF